jgi:hypothetical protein
MYAGLTGSFAYGAENYRAVAEVRDADGKPLTVPVVISLDRTVTTAERERVLAAFQTGDADTLKKALSAQPSLGFIEAGQARVPIKYAFPRTRVGGKILTIVSDMPMAHIGGDMPDAKPKEGFDFTFALIILDDNGEGRGEIAPATKLKLRSDGALTTEDYGAKTIWLHNISRK